MKLEETDFDGVSVVRHLFNSPYLTNTVHERLETAGVLDDIVDGQELLRIRVQ